MAINGVITSQTGARQFNPSDFTKYSMFVGGVNATHHALSNYSPLMNSFTRLFMVRVPFVIARMFSSGPNDMYSSKSTFMQFKHMMEYMCKSISGFAAKTIADASQPIQGGFAGRSFNTPTVTKDDTKTITTSLYEMNGSPILTVIDGWMNAIGDENSGLSHYGGLISGGTDSNGNAVRLYSYNSSDNDAYEFNESNHTCELLHIVTDRSGSQVERAVLLADVYPKSINQEAIFNNDDFGTHDNVVYNIEWNVVPYRSVIINAIANDLLKQYLIVSNSLNFNPELGDAIYSSGASTATRAIFNKSLGEIPLDSSSGTVARSTQPVFTAVNNPTTQISGTYNANAYKAAGHVDVERAAQAAVDTAKWNNMNGESGATY